MPFEPSSSLASTISPLSPIPSARKTRTLYVREEDQEVWDRAKEIIGDSLSTYITNHLRTVVASRKATQQGFERIIVRYTTEHTPQAKAFYGRWIISPTEPFATHVETESGYEPDYYAVAMTAKSKIVLFNFWCSKYVEDAYGMGMFCVFDSLEEMSKYKGPDGLIPEIMKRQGIEVQELDI